MFYRKAALSNLVCISLLGISSYSFSSEQAIENLEQEIDGYTLTLNNDAEQCSLNIGVDDKEEQLTLSLDSPCYWVTQPDSSEARHYPYPSENVSHTFLVAGTALDWDDEKKTYHKLPTDKYCSQYIQGISINTDKTNSVGETMLAPNCVGVSFDEKVFHGVALDKSASLSSEPIEQLDNAQEEQEEGFLESIKKTFNNLFKSEEAP